MTDDCDSLLRYQAGTTPGRSALQQHYHPKTKFNRIGRSCLGRTKFRFDSWARRRFPLKPALFTSEVRVEFRCHFASGGGGHSRSTGCRPSGGAVGSVLAVFYKVLGGLAVCLLGSLLRRTSSLPSLSREKIASQPSQPPHSPLATDLGGGPFGGRVPLSTLLGLGLSAGLRGRQRLAFSRDRPSLLG